MTEKTIVGQPTLTNHQRHIQHLLAVVKELRRDRETDRAEIKRLRDRVEGSDGE